MNSMDLLMTALTVLILWFAISYLQMNLLIIDGFDANNSLQTASVLQNIAQNESVSTTSFVPGINTLKQMVEVSKAAFSDIGQSFEALVTLTGGNATLVLVKTIFVICMGLALGWIFIMALFRVGGFKT